MIVDPTTEDEVFERLRVALARDGLALRRGTLDGVAANTPGRYYTTRGDSDEIVERHLDLERQARAHGVLKPNEAMVPSHGEGV